MKKWFDKLINHWTKHANSAAYDEGYQHGKLDTELQYRLKLEDWMEERRALEIDRRNLLIELSDLKKAQPFSTKKQEKIALVKGVQKHLDNILALLEKGE